MVAGAMLAGPAEAGPGSGATTLVSVPTIEGDAVRDLDSSTTKRVSQSGTGAQANARADSASISADGMVVAFRSDAINLVAGDTNGVGDVFVRNRSATTTTRVSVASNGTQATAASSAPAISADGAVVAFDSKAANLVAVDTNALADIFVHHR